MTVHSFIASLVGLTLTVAACGGAASPPASTAPASAAKPAAAESGAAKPSAAASAAPSAKPAASASAKPAGSAPASGSAAAKPAASGLEPVIQGRLQGDAFQWADIAAQTRRADEWVRRLSERRPGQP